MTGQGLQGFPEAIPIESPPAHESAFPFVGPAVVVLALQGILAAVSPQNPLLPGLSIVGAFAMGYCALAVIARGHVRLTSAEVLGFTVGLAILVTGLSALAVSVIGIGITQFVVTIIGLPLGLVSYLFHRPEEAAGRSLILFLRTWFDFSDYSRGERIVAVVLLMLIAVAAAAFVGLYTIQYPDQTSMALAITGPGGSPNVSRDFSRGVAQAIEVYVLANATPGSGPFTVRVRLVPWNATGNESFHAVSATNRSFHLDAFAEYRESNIVVGPKGSQRLPYAIVVDSTGSFRLRFDLLNSQDRTLATDYLSIVVA